MQQPEPPEHARFYFALPRVCAWIRGHDAQRRENNWIEAYAVGIANYLLSYLVLVAYLGSNVATTIALLFVTWIAWLIALYLNSVIVRLARRAGAFHDLSNSRAQSIIIGVETTACALLLVTRPGWTVIGLTWLVLVAMNIAAAIVLRVCSSFDA